MAERHYQFGDRVIHTGKPEWGAGAVTAAQPAVQDGKPCQRLTIRFDRAGLKTLSTAFATLKPAEQASDIEQALAESRNELLSGAGEKRVGEIMTRLPETASDPFASLEKRLVETVRLFRFRPDGGSLIDWAAAQSGLIDPLSRFNRHELEDFFRRFERNRDQHLAKLVAEAKKTEPQAISVAARQAPEEAQRVMRRAITR